MSEWSRRLGPRTRLGALGSFTNNQALVAAVGGMIVLVVLSEGSNSPFALPIALLVAAVVGIAVGKKRHGMPVANWTLKASAHHTGQKRWAAKPTGKNIEQLPRELGDVESVAVKDRHQLVGMLYEKQARALVATARVDLHSLGLFDVEEQARRLDAFKRILDDLARTHDDKEYRVALLSRHAPRRAHGARDHIRKTVPADKLSSPQAQAMLQVVDNTAAASHDDEFYVVIRQSARSREQAASRLIERLRTLTERLERAEIAIRSTRHLLEPRELARLIKDQYDPFGRELRDQLERAGGLPGTDPAAAWPDWRHRHVDCYETDNAVHATLWMRGWPAVEVIPGWLKPLTLQCDVPAMMVAVVMKPEDRGAALSMIRRKRTRTKSSSIFRQRHGQDDNTAHSAREEFVLRQEQELAAGGSAWHWEMYVTVSAPDRDMLDETVRKAESSCIECGLTPVLLRWAHADAFTFTLPLGRGLKPEKARL